MNMYEYHLPIHRIVFHLKPPFGLNNQRDLVKGHVDVEFQFAICWLSDFLFSWQAAIPFLENQTYESHKARNTKDTFE